MKIMAEIILTDSNFEKEVLNFKGVALVDFWATWCMPCQMLGPIIEEVSEDVDKDVVVGKINVDESKETAAKYNIMSIPAVLIFKNGELVDQLVGLRQKQDYLDAIAKYK